MSTKLSLQKEFTLGGELTVRRMGAVMGVEMKPDGAGWRMVPPTR